MVGVKVKTRSHMGRVKKAAQRATFDNLGHAGAAIRLTARRSIRRSKQASAPGKPPSTRKGRLRSAIRYAVEKNRSRVVIGPEHSVVADAGRAHEFGGRFRSERYVRRPFMGPALEENKQRLPRLWAGSVK